MFWQKWNVAPAVVLLVSAAVAGAAQPPRELLLQLQTLVQQGDLEDAASQLRTALIKFPSEPGLYNLLGTVEAQKDRRSAAEADFRKALTISPRFTGALLNLGRLYLERAATDPKDRDRALTAYQNVLLYEGNNSEALYQSAALLSAVGSYRTSLSHIDKLPAEAQSRSQVLAVRCADQSGLNDGDGAASTAERLLIAPDFTEGDVLAILPIIEQRNEPLALWMLEELAGRNAASRAVLLELGHLYMRQEKLPQAREALEHAEQAGAPSVATLSDLARVAYQQHDREGTLGYLAQARDLDPGNAAIHFFFWRGVY